MAEMNQPRGRIFRNSTPKRFRVGPGNTLVYGDKLYGPGDMLLLQGPEAVELEVEGHGEIVDYDATEAWNGEEGAKQRKGHPDYEKGGALEGQHTYAHADGHGQEVEVTQNRQYLARKH